jgi:beta-1,4-mannosyl-glycoprotein beta-1,4-N-acetylglucosaminyltransferase
MKIVDCFIFYNELKMLEFRLDYLYNTVDHFVLVEATKTHAGNPKPLFFQDNKERFSKYLDKIVHIVVDDMPETIKLSFIGGRFKPIKMPFIRENHQRRCISRGISLLELKDCDMIIISDVDEIPDRNTLKTSTDKIKSHAIYALVQDMYYYNLTNKVEEVWGYARILTYLTYKISSYDAQFVRICDRTHIIEGGGWHFSYFGDATAISNKLKNFYHQEYNTPEYTDISKIEERLRLGSSVTGEKTTYIPIESNDYLPDNYEFLM